MSTIIHPSSTTYVPFIPAQKKQTLSSRFMAWCDGQQENRLFWLALALGGHGCVLTPLSILLIVALTGMNLVLIMTALFAMAMALIVNLAALPTRITIPVLLASVLVDVLVIAAAVGISFQ